jgi:ferritin-like metal-binding protein YciE
MASSNPADAINSYITDMLSLESHIDKAIKSQIEDLKDYPDVTGELKQLQRSVQHHVSDLKDLSDRRKASGAADAVKRAGSSILGVAAGAIDLVRNEGLPKNLRDDYTALSLATIGYVMLNTTALALGDREVADLANQHFRDYTRAIMTLDRIIPAAVVRFLQNEGLPAREDAARQASHNVAQGWKEESGTTGQTTGAETTAGFSGRGGTAM